MAPLVWLITGCSSGFGSLFVPQILSRGDKVIATARDISKIQHLADASGAASILHLDLASDASAITATAKEAIAIHGRIDVLVNNAGFVTAGRVADLKLADYRAQFESNFFGTVALTQALLPHFATRKAGTVVFVSSLSGLVGHPLVSAYAASKFALEGFAEALAGEVGEEGVRTLIVEPGRFRTELLSSRNMMATNVAEGGLKQSMKGIRDESGRQPGDPEKFVRVVVDLVRGEGVAKGREVPLRVMLGQDCYEEVKNKYEMLLGGMEEWSDVGLSTDLE